MILKSLQKHIKCFFYIITAAAHYRSVIFPSSVHSFRPHLDPGPQCRGSLEDSESWTSQPELRQHPPEPKLQPQVGPN